MEAAVLRVKRKRGEDPVEALIISCKKSRSEEETPDAGDVTTQVFKLAATVASQNEPVQKYIQKAISQDRATQLYRPSIGSVQQIQKDLRTSRHAERQKSRYRLVSSLRPKSEEDGDNVSDKSQPNSPVEEEQHEAGIAEASARDGVVSKGQETFQVVDLEQEEPEKEPLDLKTADPETIMCNSVKMIRERLTVSEEGQCSEHRENPEEFVYDIYYAEYSPHNWIQGILSVQPYHYEQELVAEADEPEEIYEDEDDENEETNWRNDYPDEEECSDQEDREERDMGYYEDSDDYTNNGPVHAWAVYRQDRPNHSDVEEYSD